MIKQYSFVCAQTASVLLIGTSAWAGNLIKNPGFEADLTNWSSSVPHAGTVVSDLPHSGTKCLLIVDNNTSGNVDVRSDKIAVDPGKSYLFEVWVRAALNEQKLSVTLSQYNDKKDWLHGKNIDFVINAGLTWSNLHIPIHHLDPQTRYINVVLRPAVWTISGKQTGKAWFDDVLFTETSSVVSLPYGSWIAANGTHRVWFSSTDQNVFPSTHLEDTAPTVDTLQVHAARGEFEAFQLVLLPSTDDQLINVSVSQLRDPSNNIIPNGNVSIREVAYIDVKIPSDMSTKAGLYPDPLPELTPPLSLMARKQQPLWMTVKIPTDALAGHYTGTMELSFAKSKKIQLPLNVRVWDFAIPKQRHHRTSFGLSPTRIRHYHHLNGNTAKQKETYYLYLKDFSEHRIDSVDPFIYDAINIGYSPGWNWEQGTIVPDPDDISHSNRILEINDNSTDKCIAASTEVFIPIESGKKYQLSWKARTNGVHDYLVALNQYKDKNNHDWIPGSNIDYVKQGNGTWKSELEVLDISHLNPQTRYISIRLYAVSWSEKCDQTGRTFFDDLVFKKVNTDLNLIPNGSFDKPVQSATLHADFSRFDTAAQKAFDELGIDSFRLDIPNFLSLAIANIYYPSLLGFRWNTKEYEHYQIKVIQTLTQHLKDKGWLDKAYFYQLDEPDMEKDEIVKNVQAAMALLHKADPKLKRLLTEPFKQELDGHVDIWTPLFGDWGAEWTSNQQKQGKEVWWYTCTGPKAPYMGYFIDHKAIERRLSMWLAAKYNVQGTLYWNVNYWAEHINTASFQDPWKDPQSYCRHLAADCVFGNGDGRLLYPPRQWKDGKARVERPTPSTRWEQLRDGLEDIEYFWLLRTLADTLEKQQREPQWVSKARNLCNFPETIATSLTNFTDNPHLLASWRIEMGNHIEKMSQAVYPTPDAGTDAPITEDTSSTVSDCTAEDSSPNHEMDGSADRHNSAEGCGCRLETTATGKSWRKLVLGALFLALIAQIRKRFGCTAKLSS